MNITEQFPADWLCEVTVHRSGGYDANGDPVPAQDHNVSDCLVGRRGTSEPQDRTELTDTTAVLYGPAGMDVISTDTITVPAPHGMAGEYTIDGDPGFWPLGTEVPLRRR